MKPLRRRSSARHGGRNRDAREQARLTSHPPSVDDETLSVDVIACPRSQEDHRAYEFTGDIKSALRETLSKVKQPCGRTFEILRTPPPLRRDPLHNLSTPRLVGNERRIHLGGDIPWRYRVDLDPLAGPFVGEGFA